MHPEAQAEEAAADAEVEGAAENERRTEFNDTSVKHQIIRITTIPRSNP
jgi:hypothetical protein